MLTPGAVAALEEARSAVRTFYPGESIFRRGDRPTAIYTLTSGWAALHHDLPDGRGGITSFVLPGDVFGLSPGGAPTAATATAITQVSVCSIPIGRHDRLRHDFEDLNERFIWQMERESSLMFETLSHIAGASALTRIGHLLQTLAVRALAPRPLVEGEAIWLPVTQLHMAAATGLTPVHVSRTLQRLRGERLLELKKQKLTILDLVGLEAIVGSSPEFLSLWGGAD
jgi:CRP-like cAMP-binding protein